MGFNGISCMISWDFMEHGDLMTLIFRDTHPMTVVGWDISNQLDE